MPTPRELIVALALAAAFGLPPGVASAEAAETSPPATVAIAATVKPMDGAERRAVVDSLAKALEDNFVFPDVAARYGAMLRHNLTAGAYDGLTDPTAFAARVTADLQSVAKDGHLRLDTQANWDVRGKAMTAADPAGLGLDETRMIGDVAYLRYSLFDDDEKVTARARRFLVDHADARAVIIDSRGNHGGGLGMMNAVLPLLYEHPALLVRMDVRASVGDGPFPYAPPYLVRQPSPATLVRADHRVTPDPQETRLQQVPVYYLTSGKTASAAEHLALAFKRTHRAILIGETTRGAGHFGGLQPIGARFAAFIPVGRTYDPDTDWDWEGKGVAPDIAVPADQALDEALKRAKAAGAHPA